MATEVMLAPVFALVSLAAVDITADEVSELSDVQEGSLSCGGSNFERVTSLPFTDKVRRGGISWANW